MPNDPYASTSKVTLSKLQPPVEQEPVEETLATGFSTKISGETKRGLEELAKAMKDQPAEDLEEKVEEEEEEEEEDGKIDLGEHSEEIAQKYSSVFYRNTPIDNPDTRKKIEAKCSELDFEDLILTGRVLQRVPIMQGKLMITFQSLKAKDVMWLEREASKIENEYEARTWIGYARLTACIASINNKLFEEHLNKKSDISSAKFKSKFEQVMNLNERLIEVLLVNLNWFEDRVAQLFNNDFEQLKNG